MISLRKNIEIKTIKVMISLYCKKHHHHSDLCHECQELEQYALSRIEKCPFGDMKPACSQCEIHCYKKDMKVKVQDVMRFSGPRMLLYHPFYALIHILVKLLPLPTQLKKN